MSQKIHVLAGGLGSRISHLYPDLPKALVPINGKPFISWKIKQLRDQGFEEICFLLGHKSKQIEEYLNAFEDKNGISLKYDGEILQGTGGAIFSALNQAEERFTLTFGDNLLPLSIDHFKEFCQRTSGSVMTVTSFCGPSDFPNVDVVDGRVVRYTKSKLTLLKYVDYGLFNFLTEDLMLIHTQTTSQVTIDLSIILNGLIEKRLLFGHEISEPYYEIGTKSGILQTEKYLKGATN